MKTIKKINTVSNTVLLEDFTLKLIDNYLLELEDKLLQIEDVLNGYVPINKEMREALNKIEEIIRK
jgi:hypothetical protein